MHILHLPKWYPNHEDPQLGVFVQKQFEAASKFAFQSLIYVKSDVDQEEDFKIEERKGENFLELSIYYKRPRSRAKQYLQIRKAYNMGLEIIEERHSEVSLVHVHNLLGPAVFGDKLASKRKIPWVLSEHWSGFTPQRPLFKEKVAWEKKLWQWYAEKAECTIAVSSFLKNALEENQIGKKVLVIPNVVEDIAPSKVEEELLSILMVNDLDDDVKNISSVLHAYAELGLHTKGVRLDIIGGGKDEKALQRLSLELNIDEGVHWHGRMANDEVLPFYQKATYVLVNSRVETFSVVAAEALMAGKPVISTRCGGGEEFLNETCAILIAADNQQDLKEAILSMNTNFKNYDPQKLHDYAFSLFSKESVGRKLHELYSSLIQ